MKTQIDNSTILLNTLFQTFNAQAVLINDQANILKQEKPKPSERQCAIVALVDFLGYSNLVEFQKIFGESLGAHLWAKFYDNGKYSYNFLNQVSNGNLIILENYLRRM